MKKKNRNGLSALDVIVTIVILLVLAALLLPAVQHGHPTNHRSQCKNKLKQIGLALYNYHDVHRTFPPGWIASETAGQSSGFGWNFQILPFFDQAPLYKKFDSRQKLSNQASGNSKLASTIITAARCPDDKGPDQAASHWMSQLGTTNYVANFGVGIPATYSTIAGSEEKLVAPKFVQGIFGPNTRIRIRDVKDGMSNVILVGERRMSDGGTEWPLGKSEGSFNSYWAGIPNINAVNPLVVVATATGGLIEKCDESDLLCTVGNLKAVQNSEDRKALPYFGINRDSRGTPLQTADGHTAVTAGFSSWHTGGCQAVLGDGTVRFLSENIDPIVFTNLMRRSDGETLGEF
jgi:Tfp pilus assembly protein PilE